VCTDTAEFKESAVKLAVESDQSATKIAEELGVNKNTLHTWISKYHGPQKQKSGQVEDQHVYDEAVTQRKQAPDGGARYLKKSRGILCEGKLVKYAFIKSNQGTFSVSRLCEVMGVSPSTYYDWLKRPASILTMEDLFEEVVGEIDVGYDFDENQPKRRLYIEHENQNSHLMSGRMPISEVNDNLHTEFPVTEAHTIGGFVVSRLRRIAREGDSIEAEGYRVTVLESDERSVIKVRVERIGR
jgi:transposase-like protein